MTAVHRRLTRRLLVGLLALALSGCSAQDASGPGEAGVLGVDLPPPLVDQSPATRVPSAEVDLDAWRLPPPQPDGLPWLRLFYGQDLRAELEACGCPGSPTGGFSRRKTVLAQTREALPDMHLVEGPNALTRKLTGLERLTDQDKARARLVLELLAEMGTEAFFPGQADLAVLPPAQLASAAAEVGLPVVATNLVPDARPPGWRDAMVIPVGDRRVLLLGLLGSPRNERQARSSPVVPPVRAVAAAREAYGPVDVVVAFTSATDLERRSWDEALEVDVLLAPFEGEEQLPERWRGDRYEVSADPLGRALRRLDLALSGVRSGVSRQPDAEITPRAVASQEDTWLRLHRIRETLATQVANGEDPRVMVRGYDGVVRPDPSTDPDLVQRGLAERVVERSALLARLADGSTRRHVSTAGTIVLPPDVLEDPLVVERIDRFGEQWLGELERIVAAARGTQVDDGRRYGGMDTCVGCHPAEYAQWGRTAHRSAYATLREHAEHRNPECLTCHATGFGREGGFADPDTDRRLLNVQCEACHGPMADHAREAASGTGALAPSPGLKVDETTCRTCHDPANSPRFDYEEYLPRGAHPGRLMGGGRP